MSKMRRTRCAYVPSSSAGELCMSRAGAAAAAGARQRWTRRGRGWRAAAGGDGDEPAR
jgi:hypothetical protein